MKFYSDNTVKFSNGVSKANDERGLQAYMLTIYNYMSAGLILTGIMAWLAAHSPAFMNAVYLISDGHIVGIRPLGWVVSFAPLAFVLYLSLAINKMSLFTAQVSFWAYSAVMGLSLSSIFQRYTEASLTSVFLVTAVTFGGMSAYGYITQRNLANFRSFLMMGLFGVVIASIVNMFLQSSALLFVLSVLSVVVFTGLTAYDTQRLKEIYLQGSSDSDGLKKVGILGALTLYLDFINLFMSLLNLTNRRQ